MDLKDDDFLLTLAAEINRQQGLSFDTLQQAEQHTKQTAHTLQSQLQLANDSFMRGLTILSESKFVFVANTCRALLDNLTTPEQIQKIILTQIANNDSAVTLFSEAVNSYYDQVDYASEECVISVFLMLFPVHIQPYTCYGTLLWRRDGVETASKFYEQIVDAFEDPVLDYFAAHCLRNSTNRQKAKELLQRAYTKATDFPERYTELLPQLKNLMH